MGTQHMEQPDCNTSYDDLYKLVTMYVCMYVHTHAYACSILACIYRDEACFQASSIP